MHLSSCQGDIGITKKSRRLFVGIIVGICLLSGVCYVFRYVADVNAFTDNPGVIQDVTDDGTVILMTYQGRVTGPFAGVQWHSGNERFLMEARRLIQRARRDNVDWGYRAADGVFIYYPDGRKTVFLNEKLQALSSQF